MGEQDEDDDEEQEQEQEQDVKTTQNSTGGTGTHSAGKLTKTEVDGKEDSWLWEKKEDKPLLFSVRYCVLDTSILSCISITIVLL